MTVTVDTCWDCPICGDILQVTTEAEQEPTDNDHHAWWAYDNDKITCSDCGGEGAISCDGEGPIDYQFDEDSDHNCECFRRWSGEEE